MPRSSLLCFATIASLLLHSASGTDVFTPIPGEENLPRNNRCINAYDLELDKTLEGTTENAVFDGFDQAACGPRSDRAAVWYEIPGNGNRFKISVCSKNGNTVDYGVFTMCNDVQACVGGPPSAESDCNAMNTVDFEFRSQEGTTYFIHVRAEFDKPAIFNVVVTDIDENTQNNNSPSAAPVGVHASMGSILSMAAGAALL